MVPDPEQEPPPHQEDTDGPQLESAQHWSWGSNRPRRSRPSLIRSLSVSDDPDVRRELAPRCGQRSCSGQVEGLTDADKREQRIIILEAYKPDHPATMHNVLARPERQWTDISKNMSVSPRHTATDYGLVLDPKVLREFLTCCEFPACVSSR